VRKKKRKAAYRSKKKANTKRDANSGPKIVRRDHILRLMNPLWISGGVLLGIAGLMVTLLPPSKYIALWVAFAGVMLNAAALFVWFHALIVEDDRTLPPNGLNKAKEADVALQSPPSPLRQPRFSEKPDEIRVRLGESPLFAKPVNEKGETTFRLVSLKDNPDAIMARFRDGQLFLTVDVLSANNQRVRVENNQLKGKPDGWDQNSNDNALEIVDAESQPRLQIIFENEYTVTVSGLFIVGGQVISAGRGGLSITPAGAPFGFLALPKLFQYPSWKYPGVLAGPTPPPIVPPRPKPSFNVKREELVLTVPGAGPAIATFRDAAKVSLLKIDGHDVALAEVVGDKLRVTANLLGANIQVTGKDVEGLPKSWDVNSDDSSIEIVNGERLAMLQIEYKQDWYSELRGVFSSNDVCVVSNDKNLEQVKPGSVADKALPLMFKYPSWKYPGMLEQRTTTPPPMKNDQANRSIVTTNQSGGQNIIASGDVNLAPRPRDVTPESRQKLLALLATAPKGQVAVMSLMGDSESALFAHRIIGVLSEAGYSAHQGQTSGSMPGPPVFGVEFWTLAPNKLPEHFEPLLKAFNESGIQVHLARGVGAHPEQVYIFVAARPPE
jgi:hypothetical protein